ncbi:hypothetical protein NAT51_15385 [Flavobacterium amniphilum]|uniref:hypothetical protein n=1 Tax=Flavobacterium amniphilum TaxID=1834035 RepID=UPI00202A0213|nr:hypothetical protein [Flavobacterium amniphilum]MCL9806918.1 hypothetical protein [Flavobacterium amniphilum]
MVHTIELFGSADQIYKMKLISILKEFTGYGIDKAAPLANSLCNLEVVILRLEVDESTGNEFLMEVSALGVAIRDFSWHEENDGGGLRAADPED